MDIVVRKVKPVVDTFPSVQVVKEAMRDNSNGKDTCGSHC